MTQSEISSPSLVPQNAANDAVFSPEANAQINMIVWAAEARKVFEKAGQSSQNFSSYVSDLVAFVTGWRKTSPADQFARIVSARTEAIALPVNDSSFSDQNKTWTHG
jgi:hypothetical protein